MDLTKIEQMIVNYIGLGKSDRYICKELSLTIHQVKRRVASILKKYNIKRRTQLMLILHCQNTIKNRRTIRQQKICQHISNINLEYNALLRLLKENEGI